MKIQTPVDRLILAGLNVALLFATLLPAGAASLTWNGTSSGSWALAANWTGGTIGTGDDLNLTGAVNPADFIGGTGARTINSLTFKNTAAAAFTVALATLADGTGTARNLNFQSGNTGITIESGDSYAHTIGVGGGSVNLQGNLTVTHNGSQILTINRPIIGSGFSLTKSGPGPLTLSGLNSYSGGTTISSGGGTLTIGGAGTLSGNITNDSSFICNSSADQTIVGVLSGAGSWEQKGPGALTLTSTTANTLTGNLTLSSGILKAGYGNVTVGVRNANLGTGAATLTLNGGELQCANAGNANYNRNTTVGGNATITSSSSTGTDGFTYTFGTLAIGSQTLTIQASTQTTGTAGVTLGDATLTDAPTFLVNNNGLGATALLTLGAIANGANLTTFDGTGNSIVVGVIGSGAGGLTKNGAGTLTLSAANTFGGNTRIGAGMLTLGNASALQNSTLDLNVADSGALNFDALTTATVGGLTGSRNLGLTNTTSANVILSVGNNNADTTYSGILSDGGLTKVGNGTLTLTGANTFTNKLAISAGTVSVPTVNDAGTPGPLGATPSVAGLLVTLGTSSGGIGTLEYTGNTAASTKRFILGAVSAGTGIFQIGNTVATLTLSGAITGPGNLIKAGPGSLALGGGNTYTGATTVSNGTLLINGSLATSSAVTVLTNATLGGSGIINGAVTVNSGAMLSPGASIGTLSISNSLTLNASSSTLMEIKGTGTNDSVRGLTAVNYGGTLTVTNLIGTNVLGDTYVLFIATSYGSGFSATNLPPLTGSLTWNWNPTNGTLSVVSGTATTTTNISYSATSTTLSLTWPGSHLGWYAQSNAVDIANPNYWFNIPRSEAVTNLSITIDPSLPNVFYRLKMP